MFDNAQIVVCCDEQTIQLGVIEVAPFAKSGKKNA